METPTANFSPYRIMLKKAKSPDFLSLVESLAETSNKLDSLNEEYPNQITANREKREGKPVRLAKWKTNFVANSEKDALIARADLERQYEAMTDEKTLLKSALAGEKFLYKTWAFLYDSAHADDKLMATEIRSLQKKLIDDMEAFLAKAN